MPVLGAVNSDLRRRSDFGRTVFSGSRTTPRLMLRWRNSNATHEGDCDIDCPDFVRDEVWTEVKGVRDFLRETTWTGGVYRCVQVLKALASALRDCCGGPTLYLRSVHCSCSTTTRRALASFVKPAGRPGTFSRITAKASSHISRTTRSPGCDSQRVLDVAV